MPPTEPPGAGRIGDRLERAIEDHADVAATIARGEATTPPRYRMLRRAAWLFVTGISLYLVAPSLLSMLGSWQDLDKVGVGWLALMVLLQTIAIACIWALQHLALHVQGWFPVITSQLASNALGKVAPGGGAVGAALQYRMLVTAGARRATAVSALTATNLLTFAVVLALPVFAIPSIVRGAVDRSLVEATIVAAIIFALLLGLSTACAVSDRPLRAIGRAVQSVRNRLRRSSPPLTGLPTRLLHERDLIMGTLGPRYKPALLATIGRWAFDYATLLAALAAVGSYPRASLVLLAFCVAQVLSQVPVTPGGLGFVEAGLTAMLQLAGVSLGDAVLATFAYRLVSYWLPLPAGLVGLVLHRRRYPART